MTIEDRLNDLITAKADMKSAIESKGVDVTGGLSTYADAIRSIESGGGEGSAVPLPDGTRFSSSRFEVCPSVDTSNMTAMDFMFHGCHNITTTPLYDTSKVTNMRYMFHSCDNLVSVAKYDTSKVVDMESMFEGCKNLISIPEFDTSALRYAAGIFNGCYNLTTIPKLNFSKVTSLGTYAFTSTSALKHLGGFTGVKVDLNLDYSNAITRESMLNVFNEMATASAKITITQTVYNRLSDTDISIATNKGWRLFVTQL